METLNLKYGRFVLGACVGGFLITAFLNAAARHGSISAAFWVVWFVIGAITMFWVWKDIAKNGIRTAQMMVPGIFVCGSLGMALFIGLVQLCLTQNHGRDDLRNWAHLWVAVGVVANAISFLVVAVL